MFRVKMFELGKYGTIKETGNYHIHVCDNKGTFAQSNEDIHFLLTSSM